LERVFRLPNQKTDDARADLHAALASAVLLSF
jgi:hypothetical protein